MKPADVLAEFRAECMKDKALTCIDNGQIHLGEYCGIIQDGVEGTFTEGIAASSSIAEVAGDIQSALAALDKVMGKAKDDVVDQMSAVLDMDKEKNTYDVLDPKYVRGFVADNEAVVAGETSWGSAITDMDEFFVEQDALKQAMADLDYEDTQRLAHFAQSNPELAAAANNDKDWATKKRSSVIRAKFALAEKVETARLSADTILAHVLARSGILQNSQSS